MRKILISSVSATLIAFAASSAQAAEPSAEPSTDHPVSIAVLGGFGINNLNGDGGDTLNIYGAGFGARAGYTLPMNLYLGGLFQYNLGASIDAPDHSSVKGRIMNVGGEVGYNYDIVPQFTLRPYVGVGVAIAGGDIQTLDKTSPDSKTKFSLWPGVQGLYNINDQIYAGLDVRYTLVFADLPDGLGNVNSLGFYGTVGYRF